MAFSFFNARPFGETFALVESYLEIKSNKEISMFKLGLIPLLVLGIVGCANAQKSADENRPAAYRGDLQGKVKGDVVFTKNTDGKGVKMILNAQNAGAGFHGVHIHETPVCEGDFTSAGGHFNPMAKTHGSPNQSTHHVGDLGNIKADDEGNMIIEKVYEDLSLNQEDDNYIGDRALVVHAKADDYQSQPSGASGKRIGCAVLQNAAE